MTLFFHLSTDTFLCSILHQNSLLDSLFPGSSPNPPYFTPIQLLFPVFHLMVIAKVINDLQVAASCDPFLTQHLTFSATSGSDDHSLFLLLVSRTTLSWISPLSWAILSQLEWQFFFQPPAEVMPGVQSLVFSSLSTLFYIQLLI